MPVLNSTKNLEIVEPPTATKEGVGIFEYTDNYTVFHYGRMPDLIPGKGEAICRMAVFNFTRLEAAGVPTHFRRFIAPNRIEFDLARTRTRTPGRSRRRRKLPHSRAVPLPKRAPQGSRSPRLAAGGLTPAQVGLRSIPAVGEKLKHPLIEYATTLKTSTGTSAGLRPSASPGE